VRGLLTLVLVLSAATASAQPVFVQGTVGVDIKRFSGEAATSVFDGSAQAFAIGAGGHLAPHWTLLAELDISGQSSQTTTTTVAISGQPRDIHNTYSSERRGLSALVGYETSPHRGVQVVYYAGLGFSTFRREISSDADQVVLQAPAPTSDYTDRLTGPIVGVDLEVHVAPHLSVVPSFRAQGLPLGGDLGGHSIRPSIGARVSF
jgi:Outer membrane protein beta-barrel domain